MSLVFAVGGRCAISRVSSPCLPAQELTMSFLMNLNLANIPTDVNYFGSRPSLRIASVILDEYQDALYSAGYDNGMPVAEFLFSMEKTERNRYETLISATEDGFKMLCSRAWAVNSDVAMSLIELASDWREHYSEVAECETMMSLLHKVRAMLEMVKEVNSESVKAMSDEEFLKLGKEMTECNSCLWMYAIELRKRVLALTDDFYFGGQK